MEWTEERRWTGVNAPGWIDHVRSGRHHVWLEPVEADRATIVWDGQPAGPFTILPQQHGGPFAWSPDLEHVAAYTVGDDGYRVWADGRLGPVFEGVTRSVAITFSPDGTRLAYGAYVDGVPRLVVDGEVMATEPLAPLPPMFSPDSRRLAWAEHLHAEDPKAPQRMVIDGVAGEWVAGLSADPSGRQWSPDSRRFAHYEILAQGSRFIVDGVAGPPILDAREPAFSPDSRRFVYVARFADGWALVDEGQVHTRYEDVEHPSGNEDTGRIAYCAKANGWWAVVVDRVEGPWHARTAMLAVLDNGRVAYASGEAGKGLLGKLRTEWRVVIDGRPVDEYAWDGVAGLVTYDGAHLVYGGEHGKERRLVIDGRAGPAFRELGFRLMRDGRIAYTALTDRGSTVVMDGERPVREVAEVGAPDPERILELDGEGRLLWSARLDDGRWHPMLDAEAGPACDMVTAPWVDEAGRTVFSVLRGIDVVLVRPNP